jgi:hypothetical protein
MILEPAPPEGSIDFDGAVVRLYRRKYGGVHREEDGRGLKDARLALRSYRYAARRATCAPNLSEAAKPVRSPEPSDQLDEAALGPMLCVPVDQWFLGDVAPERFIIDCKVDIREAVLRGELALAVWMLDARRTPLAPPRNITVEEAALLPTDIRPKPSKAAAEAPADPDIAWAVFRLGANQRHPATFRSSVEGPGRYPDLRRRFDAPRVGTMILLLDAAAFERWLDAERARGHWPSVRAAQSRAELTSATSGRLPGKTPPGRPTKLTKQVQAAVWDLTDRGRWSPARGSAASLRRALVQHHPLLPVPSERAIRSWLRTGALVLRRPD